MTKQDLSPLIKRLIEKEVNNQADTYTHNGSTWIIFTDEKKWVIELTKEKTLWYNYYFFTKIFKLIGLDVVENQHYITKWVEDEIINKKPSQIGVMGSHHQQHSVLDKVENTIENGVKSTKKIKVPNIQDIENNIQNGVNDTAVNAWFWNSRIEDTIDNGVKNTVPQNWTSLPIVEYTIENGVKSTKGEYYREIQKVEYTIQNGVKDTRNEHHLPLSIVEDTIQNGVKDTLWNTKNMTWIVEDTIQNGVKETKSYVNNDFDMNDAIENGVKKTLGDKIECNLLVEDTIQNGVKQTHAISSVSYNSLEDTIQNGVKHTEYGDWLDGDERLDDIIENGVKNTYSDKIPHDYDWSDQFTEEIDDIIENGVILTRKSLQIDGSLVVEDVVENGIKATKPMDEWVNTERIIEKTIQEGVKLVHARDNNPIWVEEPIKNGIKQTKTPGEDGDIVSVMKFMKEHNSNNVPKMVDEIIENGIKQTKREFSSRTWKSEEVIKNGVKGTKAGGYLGSLEMNGKTIHQFETAKQLYYVEEVIDSGIKKTEGGVLFDESKIDRVIIEGVKETKCAKDKDIYDPYTFVNQKIEREMRVKEVIDNGIKETHDDVMPHTGKVEDVIKNGIKEVQPLPAQDGNRDWGNYYHRQEDRTKPHTQYVDDVIKKGYICD